MSLTCCEDRTDTIYVGGNVAYFTVEGSDAQKNAPAFDVFVSGMGQYGALGNGTYVQAQGTPVKAKVISGNVMCMSHKLFVSYSTRLNKWAAQLMKRPIHRMPFAYTH